MIGREFPSEKYYYRDPKTGFEVCRLTGGDANNFHFYFTDNSFTLGDREIYFLSDRGQPERFNILKMDLDTGRMIQITDEKDGIEGRATKTPDSQWLIYRTGNKLKKVNTRTGANEIIFEEPVDFELGMASISCDQKHVGIVLTERVNIVRGPNYTGFKAKLFAVKKSRISLIRLDNSQVTNVYDDTHWIAHFQFAPDDNGLVMFCHEGPWNLVHQRIWLLKIDTREVNPCFRQGEDDCVGHEFWTRDSQIFFDNRRAGHDGTITSRKTQATITAPVDDQLPFVGLADKTGQVVKTIDMPYYCNHYHANNDNSILVGDEIDDLVLIDIKGQKPILKKLCQHNTSWYTSRTHCHPTFGWNGEKILFASDIEGKINLYLTDTRCLE